MARKPKAQTSTEDKVAEELAVPDLQTDPYIILGVDKSASQEQIKTAYRKAALKHHPDKAQPHDRDEANKKFQEIALAYAILSDERRRKRYDTTGNTAESLNVDDDDFDWVDYFREQTAAMVDGEMIDKIKREYQGSTEEKEDVLQAYSNFEGDMDAIYEEVMCSNVIDDDQRFRAYIDEAIADGEVDAYSAYVEESKAKRKRRIDQAQGEAQEAMELAEELGVKEKLFGKGKSGGKKSKGDDQAGLMALIQQRAKDRSATFLDHLETKYGGGNVGKRGKRPVDEPPEELFQRNMKKSKGAK